ncbi:MAG: long-chain-acyl-CoA synthetase [Gammaproteobacteria bacterium TMED1]|nr:MAG: long-chain-acyl-CoA synthetase [Gammaproteobacteria bacterium TMED1]|tara:strand:- start:94 stop:1899 length:1806 start_codon:yes stop_codon:yes gene_type:complete
MGSLNDIIGDLKVILNKATAKQRSDDEIMSFSLLVERNAHSYPHDSAILFEDKILSWKELNEQSNRVANYLKSLGISSGDCVSLFMQNRIEFVVNVVAICKLGAIAGLINTNLTKQPLIHCINLVNSKKCIFGTELSDALEEVLAHLKLKDRLDYLCVSDNEESEIPEWATELNSGDPSMDGTTPPEINKVTLGHVAFYIFTSGTTGLPKAAVVPNRRIFTGAELSHKALLRLSHKDRIYNCLPLYHGTGLILGLAAAFNAGAGSVIRRRLSITVFWDEIRKFHCTSFIYIGEFIRYLVSQAPQKNDGENPIRSIVGNGLRPDIWLEFKERFNIERIGEFYAASEGNGGFANVFNKECTVGLGISPMKIVAYDVAKEAIVRNQDGCCIEVEQGETGLLLIEVTEKSKFDGYTEKADTDKKILEDCFVIGDKYFNTGDLMKTVDVGFAYGQIHYQFVDRIGDTFRWKSENVSTNEVGEIINKYSEILYTNVYGIEIPGTDGRAGMAAIVFKNSAGSEQIDLSSLSIYMNENLPGYARPLFIRILQELPTTTTHKLQKNELREQSFHLEEVKEELLVRDPSTGNYQKLDSDFYDRVMRREVAF